jgi:4-hydroxy 2-oxovalerate aldolase
VPYNITGQLNLHPRAAMQFRAGKDKDDLIKFYDQVVAEV